MRAQAGPSQELQRRWRRMIAQETCRPQGATSHEHIQPIRAKQLAADRATGPRVRSVLPRTRHGPLQGMSRTEGELGKLLSALPVLGGTLGDHFAFAQAVGRVRAPYERKRSRTARATWIAWCTGDVRAASRETCGLLVQ